MGKKNNNMLIYAAVASVAIVYILYKLLYTKEGFQTNPTVESCSSFCPSGICRTVHSEGMLQCMDLYYARRSNNNYTCDVNGFKGMIYDTTLNKSSPTRINPSQNVPVCLGFKYHIPNPSIPPGIEVSQAAIDSWREELNSRKLYYIPNTDTDYRSICNPDNGEVPVVQAYLDRTTNSYVRAYIRSYNEGGRRVAFGAKCLRFRTVLKGKEKDCRVGDFANITTGLTTNFSVKDRDNTKKFCYSFKEDTGEPTPYYLD